MAKPVPQLLVRHARFIKDLRTISSRRDMMGYLDVSGTISLNNVENLDQEVAKLKTLVSRIDDWTDNPTKFDNGYSDICSDLQDLYSDIVTGTSFVVDHGHPGIAFDPDKYTKLVDNIFTVEAAAELYGQTSVGKMLGIVADMVLNVGILPCILAIYPALTDGSTPDVQVYSDQVPDGCMIQATMSDKQLFFTEEEIKARNKLKVEQEARAMAAADEAERQADTLRRQKRLIEAFGGDSPLWDVLNPLSVEKIKNPVTAEDCNYILALSTFLSEVSKQLHTTDDQWRDAIKTVCDTCSSLVPLHLCFTQVLTPTLAAAACRMFARVTEVRVLGTKTEITEFFDEEWTPGDIFTIN